jgi:hypothetical protein
LQHIELDSGRIGKLHNEDLVSRNIIGGAAAVASAAKSAVAVVLPDRWTSGASHHADGNGLE